MSTETTALTVGQRAVAALGYDDENRKGLKTLAAESTHITAITNADGREQAHAAMMKLKNTRITIEKRGKDAREDATAFSKAVIAEEKALIGIIGAEESRLCKLRDEWDDKIEAAKQALIKAEMERATAIQRRIDDIRGAVAVVAKLTDVERIRLHIADIEQIAIDATFETRAEAATVAKDETLAHLRQMYDAAVSRKVEDDRLAAERVKLAQERAEQEKRDAEAKRIRDEAAAAENARLRAEREKFEADQAASREAQRKENERIAAEQAAAQKVIDDQRSELARAQREAREADEARERARLEEHARLEREAAPPAPTTVESIGGALVTHIGDERPSFDEIVRAVAWHFETDEDTVRGWICENVVLAAQEAA